VDWKIGQRKNRLNQHVRELTSSITLDYRKLVQPLFVVDGMNKREEISGMGDVYRDTPDSVLTQIESDLEKGVSKFILFGVPKKKARKNDADLPSHSFDFSVQQIQSIKKRFGDDLFLAVDVCLCSHTDHGHCGVLTSDGKAVDNSPSVEILARQAGNFAQAGADCVAPSDMMDGRIAAIRQALDELKREETLIMSYAAKFHSGYYGPFREAAHSSPSENVNPNLKNRATYQISPLNPADAYESAIRDSDEGADILMVKPGLAYLDILQGLVESVPKPWAVYQVSGEWASVELMDQSGLMKKELVHLENWTSFFRAGASIIITYGARHGRDWIRRMEI